MEGWRRRIGKLTASFEQLTPAREAARLLAARNAQDVRPLTVLDRGMSLLARARAPCSVEGDATFAWLCSPGG